MKLNDAELMARTLMSEHLHDWTLRFGNAKSFFGWCSNNRRQLITLSRPMVELNTEAEVRDVILHEIAHALAPRGEHHGEEWKRIARSIGCNGERCCGADTKVPASKYFRFCKVCGRVSTSNRYSETSCGVCHPKEYDIKFRLIVHNFIETVLSGLKSKASRRLYLP